MTALGREAPVSEKDACRPEAALASDRLCFPKAVVDACPAKIVESSPMRDRFLQDVLANRNNRAILDRWEVLGLPDGWLVAGCLFQTVWNLKSGQLPEAQIKDYDLFYFDDSDLSSVAEQHVQARVDDLLADLGIAIETKNQARVHLWYEDVFGHRYPQLHSARDGIDRFLIPATCVGIRRDGPRYDIYAPHGVDMIYSGVLSPNPLTDHAELFREKARSYLARWPWLRADYAAAAD
jgi:hypothetical protein